VYIKMSPRLDRSVPNAVHKCNRVTEKHWLRTSRAEHSPKSKLTTSKSGKHDSFNSIYIYFDFVNTILHFTLNLFIFFLSYYSILYYCYCVISFKCAIMSILYSFACKSYNLCTCIYSTHSFNKFQLHST